jgi:hypothetical protein
MTIAVALLAEDGVVLGADSAVTLLDGGGEEENVQTGTQKLWFITSFCDWHQILPQAWYILRMK